MNAAIVKERINSKSERENELLCTSQMTQKGLEYIPRRKIERYS